MENFSFCAVLCTAETEGVKLDENTGVFKSFTWF